jgi:hypothetical protein
MQQIETGVDSPFKQVLGQADTYFNSVDSAFQYTLVRQGKSSPVQAWIGGPLSVFLMLSILPVFPYVLTTLVPRLAGQSWSIVGLQIPTNSFWLWWVLCSSSALLLSLLYTPLDKRISEREKNKKIPANSMAFCHLYMAMRELRAYLVNQRKPHLADTSKHLRLYLYWSDTYVSTTALMKYLPSVTKDRAAISVSLSNLINVLRENYPWFRMTDDTTQISKAFGDFSARLLERIEQGIEIDKVLQCLGSLLAYEYSILKTPFESKAVGSGLSLAEFGNTMLCDFANSVLAMSSLQRSNVAAQKSTVAGALQSISHSLNGVLNHPNILICSIGWYAFLSILFIPTSLLIIKGFLHIAMDSTIVIGIITTPFIAAIAVSTAIYTRSAR